MPLDTNAAQQVLLVSQSVTVGKQLFSGQAVIWETICAVRVRHYSGYIAESDQQPVVCRQTLINTPASTDADY